MMLIHAMPFVFFRFVSFLSLVGFDFTSLCGASRRFASRCTPSPPSPFSVCWLLGADGGQGGMGRWGLDGIVSLVLTLLLYGLCSSERLIILQSW